MTHFWPALSLHLFVMVDGDNGNRGFWHCSAAAHRMLSAGESCTELFGDVNTEPQVAVGLLGRRVVW